MSTRCNIVLESNLDGRLWRLWLYRHHDGYLAGAGADLVQSLAKFMADPYASTSTLNPAASFANLLLQERQHGRNVYEVTDAIHGDIDFLYRVTFYTLDQHVEARIGVADVSDGGLDADPCDPHVPSEVEPLRVSLEEFLARVNAERLATAERLAAWKSDAYADEIAELRVPLTFSA